MSEKTCDFVSNEVGLKWKYNTNNIEKQKSWGESNLLYCE